MWVGRLLPLSNILIHPQHTDNHASNYSYPEYVSFCSAMCAVKVIAFGVDLTTEVTNCIHSTLHAILIFISIEMLQMEVLK